MLIYNPKSYGILIFITFPVSVVFANAIEMINKKEHPNAGHLEDFLDTMRDKYEGHADISSKRVFGTDNIINKDYMLRLGEKNEDS